MNDDAGQDDPLDEIEARHGIATLARMARVFYLELLEQGFDVEQAMRLTIAQTTRPTS